MRPFVATIRRVPGGVFAKMPKSQAMTAVPVQTSLNNLATYFTPWPKRKSQFILYGCQVRRASFLAEQDLKNGHQQAHGLEASDSAPEHLYGPSQGTALPLAALAHGGTGAKEEPAGEAGRAAAAVQAAAAARPLGLAGVVQRFRKGEKLSMVTAYDFPSARFARSAGVELVLVGDSLGNCRLGLPDTIGVTMEDMLRATTAVRRGVDAAALPRASAGPGPGPKPVVIGDMPFGSYLLEADALRNAAAFRVAGADMVKLEGGSQVVPLVRSLTSAGIAVMGHIGLEPQKAFLQGGLRLQGTTAPDALQLIRDAEALAKAGARLIVVECVPEEVGWAIQAHVPSVPIIGIGAGGKVAGQVLVCDDMLGVHGQPPSFAKMFADVGTASATAYSSYVSEVRSGSFPGETYSRHMKPEELKKLKSILPEESANFMGEGPPANETPKPVFYGAPLVATFANIASNGSGLPTGSHWPGVTESNHKEHPFANGLSRPSASGSAHEIHPGGRLAVLPARLNGSTPHVRFAARCTQTAAAHTAAGLQLLRTRAEVRSWRRAAAAAGRTVGLVPTMGNLHEGHLELVDEAKARTDDVLATVFVNPAQFAAHEDLDKYPRTLQRDVELLRAQGAAAVFAPEPTEMYPEGSPGFTVVVPRFVDGKSEAASRPTHFMGVATVCLKLFNLCEPDVAVFGQKDAMQCAVIARMLEDFMLSDKIRLIIAPTSREFDGLARSSRNSYLTEGMRQKAPAIYRALSKWTSHPGATAGSVRAAVKADLEAVGFHVEYVSVADSRLMGEKEEEGALPNSVVSVAVQLKEDSKECRLIDNVVIPGLHGH